MLLVIPLVIGGRWFPLQAWTRDAIHLGCNLVEERQPIIALLVQVEMRPVRDVDKVRIGIQIFEDSFKLVGSTIKVEGVRGADENVNLALEIGAAMGPVRGDDMRKIIVIAPIGNHCRIDVSRIAVEHLQG